MSLVMGKSLRIISLLALVSIFYACGDGKKNDSDSKDSTQTQNQTDDKTSGDNNSSGDQTGDDKNTSNDLGMKEGLPADFPSDVPQPPDSKVIGSLSSSEGTNVSFESPKSTQEIADFYKGEMDKAGYKVKPDSEAISETNAMIDWNKGDKDLSLVVVRDNAKNTSSVVITYK
jgi:hypothetical protein